MKLSFEVWPNMPYGERANVGPVVNSWGAKSIPECMRAVAGHGYQGVDFVFDKLLEVPDDAWPAAAAEIRDLSAELRLPVVSVGAHTLSISPRPWDRQAGQAAFHKAIERAADIGASTVISFVRGGYYNPPTYNVLPYREAWNNCVEVYRTAADYAADHGITVSLEMLQESFANDVDRTLALLSDINRDNLYVTADFGCLTLAIKPHMEIDEAIRKLGDRLNHAHCKDVTGVIGDWAMCWFGGGIVNFREVFAALHRNRYKGFVAVEWEGWFRGGPGGRGEPGGAGLQDFDRVAVEAKEFLQPYLAGLV